MGPPGAITAMTKSVGFLRHRSRHVEASLPARDGTRVASLIRVFRMLLVPLRVLVTLVVTGLLAAGSATLAYAQEAGSLTPEEIQAQRERAFREYLTNGASVTAVPTAGRAAEYFSNGAAVMAAPTSWIQAVDPDLGAGSFGSEQDAGAAATAISTRAAADAGFVVADAGEIPDASLLPHPRARPSPPWAPSVATEMQAGAQENTEQEGADAAVTGIPAPSTTTPAQVPFSPTVSNIAIAPSAPSASQTAARESPSYGVYIASLFGAFILGGLLVFLGTRVRAPRPPAA